MGNCSQNPCGENYNSNEFNQKQNIKSVKSLFQTDINNDKNFSKKLLMNKKDIPTKIDQKNNKLTSIANNKVNINPNTSNEFLETNDFYENIQTDISHHRKIKSSINAITLTDFNTSNIKIENIHNENSHRKNEEQYHKIENLQKNGIIKFRNIDNNAIFIKDESSENVENPYKFRTSLHDQSTIYMNDNYKLNKNNIHNLNNLTLEKEELYNEIIIKDEENCDENKIVEEIKQNKIFYNSEGLKCFRKKTPKMKTLNHKDSEKYSLNPNFKLDENFDSDSNIKKEGPNHLMNNFQKSSQLIGKFHGLEHNLKEEKNNQAIKYSSLKSSKVNLNNDNIKNSGEKIKKKNLTIITNQKSNDYLNRNNEKFIKDLNYDLNKEKNMKKGILIDSIENIGDILISCENENVVSNDQEKSLLNINLITSTTNHKKKSEALLKISKKPANSNSNNYTANITKIPVYSEAGINNEKKYKVSAKNQFNGEKKNLKILESEKILEKKNTLIGAYTNNYIKSSVKINNEKEENKQNKKPTSLYLMGNSLSNQLRKININNSKLIKNSFDLSIPNNSISSTRNKSNNKFVRTRNNTPQNKSLGINGSEKVQTSKYNIDPKIFQDKNILEFINDFQINKRKDV